MIEGTGIDIVEIARIKRSIGKEDGFRELVFSKNEIIYCESKGKPFESYAGKFAAKEAFFKALGTGWVGNMVLNGVEVLNDASGKPVIHLSMAYYDEIAGLEDKTIHVSVSHSQHYATAVVIIEQPGE